MGNKMRVLHVISTLNIGSGIANAVFNYYRNIDRHNIQFDFLVFSEPEKTFTKEILEMGGRVFQIDAPTLTTSFKYAKKVKKFFKSHRNEWDWVHIHEILVQKYIVKSVKKISNAKIAIHSHNSRFVLPDHNASKLKNAIQITIKSVRNKYLLFGVNKNADAKFACSKEAGVALFGKKGIQKRFTLLPNAIDVGKFRFDQAERNRYRKMLGLEDKKVIINIARLCSQKNQVFLLDVFKRIQETSKDYALLLVGDGELREYLFERAKLLGLSDNVLFLGNRLDTPSLYSAGDIFVFPSIIEGLGISLIEAQASGLNCIASTEVPKLAQVTPYVRFLPLSAGVDVWAREIENTSLTRTDGNDIVKQTAFNLENNFRTLTDVYKG